jgi:modulator of FtsH protease HflK
MARRSFDLDHGFDLAQVDWKRIAGVVLLVIPGVAVLVALLTCFYTVGPDGRAVVKRFGAVTGVRDPGLHFKLPFWIDQHYFVPTERVLKEEFGFRTAGEGPRTTYDKRPEHRSESLMLTGDLKVIDVEWVVQYRITDADQFLHSVYDPPSTIRDISEAVMRRIVGNSLGSAVLTEKRVQVAQQTRDEMQELLDNFNMGVTIRTVELQDVNPPDAVKAAFNEVNQAEQERERFINEAERDRNTVLPRARGEALQLVEAAQGYHAERVNRAKGEAARFESIFEEYRNVPEVTRRRLYLEMIDEVLPKLGRVYVVEEGQTGPIPLLNLGEGAAARAAAGGER